MAKPSPSAVQFNIGPRNSAGVPEDGFYGKTVWRGLPAHPSHMSDVWVDTFLAVTAADLARRMPNIVEDAKSNLPVSGRGISERTLESRLESQDPAYGVDTGTLRENIYWHPEDGVRDGVLFQVEVHGATQPDGDFTGDYWEAQEFGFWHAKTGRFIPGTHAIGRAIDANSQSTRFAAMTGVRSANKMVMQASGLGITELKGMGMEPAFRIETEQD